MKTIRALIREHRRFALVLVVLAFCIKAVIPAGFMVSASGDTVLTVTVCSDVTGGVREMQLVIPGKDGGSQHSDGAKAEGHCAFAGLAKVAVAGADAFLLALAFAFVLALGLAPTRHRSVRRGAYLRPPLRGPPAIA